MMVIAFLSAKERILPPPNQKTSIKQDFKDILGSLPWKAMFVLTLFLFTTLAMWGSSMSYYFNYVVDQNALFNFLKGIGLTANTGEANPILDAFGLVVYQPEKVFGVGFSLFNMVGQLVTLIGVLLLSQRLSIKFGKRDVFIVCLALTAVFTSLFYFVPADSVGLIFGINIFRCAAYAPTIPLLWAMIGDVADHSEWVHHRRATGFVFAGVVFALKAGLGLGGAICGSIIDSFGFIANQAQTASAIQGIKLTSGIVPAISFAIGVAALFFYPITKKMNEKLQEELAQRRNN
jgi:Na+/melibiose symporter-like transporter